MNGEAEFRTAVEPTLTSTDGRRAPGYHLGGELSVPKVEEPLRRIVPIFNDYGFKPPSAGVVARDLSEKIETSIVQHCNSFTRGHGHTDLQRFERPWEVKICKGTGLTINQSKVVQGENYIVVNYEANTAVTRVWILWDAKDDFFSARKPNTNARTINMAAAGAHVEIIDERPRAKARADETPDATKNPIAAEAVIRSKTRALRRRRQS